MGLVFEKDFGPTLLYIDITNFCHIGCKFCMYKMAHGQANLNLSSRNLSSIQRLAKDAEKICISGEGEPLTKIKSILAISSIAREGQTVEVITSGGKKWSHLEKFLNAFESLGKRYRFRPRLRISFDRWHAEKIPAYIYTEVIKRRINHPFPENAAELYFRSITTDLDWAISRLSRILKDNNFLYSSYFMNELSHIFEVNNIRLPISFKNFVNPGHYIDQERYTLDFYLSSLEDKMGRPFVFGNIKTNTRFPGPDITVKPNGKIYLYGLETECHWDLSMDVSREQIINTIIKNPLIRTFYTQPLKNILLALNQVPNLSETLASINNPYWIVKCLRRKYPEEFNKIITEIVDNKFIHQENT